jgi:hypothetical protein
MRMLDSEWAVIQRPPAEGVRPYHPADQAQAIALIQRVLAVEDAEAARAVLRRWWRRIDYETLSFQREGEVVALFAAPVDEGNHNLVEIAAQEEARSYVPAATPA